MYASRIQLSRHCFDSVYENLFYFICYLLLVACCYYSAWIFVIIFLLGRVKIYSIFYKMFHTLICVQLKVFWTTMRYLRHTSGWRMRVMSFPKVHRWTHFILFSTIKTIWNEREKKHERRKFRNHSRTSTGKTRILFYYSFFFLSLYSPENVQTKVSNFHSLQRYTNNRQYNITH